MKTSTPRPVSPTNQFPGTKFPTRDMLVSAASSIDRGISGSFVGHLVSGYWNQASSGTSLGDTVDRETNPFVRPFGIIIRR